MTTKERLQWKRECKARDTAARRTLSEKLHEGTILVSSWGYDQTNIDFFQIIARTEATVTVREIANESLDTGNMTGQRKPKPNQFIGEASRRRIGPGYVMVGNHNHHTATPVDKEWYECSSYA